MVISSVESSVGERGSEEVEVVSGFLVVVGEVKAVVVRDGIVDSIRRMEWNDFIVMDGCFLLKLYYIRIGLLFAMECCLRLLEDSF